MTYNILAQKYAQGGWHSYCSPQHLRWESRRERLFEEIEACGSDIICLQEVEAPVFAGELQPWLAERGYRGHYLARQYGESVQGPAEGVALFYRTDVFDTLAHHSFLFSSVPTNPPAPLRDGLSSVDGEELGAAATAAAGATASASRAESSAAVLCQEMAAFLRSAADSPPGAVPVILAGDFNSLNRKVVPDFFDPKIPPGPDGLVSGVYTLLTRGSLGPDHPDHPATRRRPAETGNPDFRAVTLGSAGLSLASAYQLMFGREPPLTTRTSSFAGCLDYIFVSPKHFEVTRALELPYTVDGLGSGGGVRDPLADVAFPPIPNEDFPSDHLSLAALLRFKD
ncbi:hypothetical protein GPECTOR_2g1411 [Gonium pectorale]|uniref:Endonuclease/exonuclease/phosphatase domain-containing protein n=1 Tax=Gonium pectorale TaxID=33097 RepID=A0A150H2P9_GONPE|nr:hypothetical protein GPECTOR_2g1411 [Gonium pectorale]|eukprot:KXZ55860.1 hypothetical protein GPECTOR_2g1411 [Gonium pectorale]